MTWRCTCDDCGADYETDSRRVAEGWKRRHEETHDYTVEQLEEVPEA